MNTPTATLRIEVLNLGELAQVLCERLSTQRWWCFMSARGSGLEVPQEIESRFFGGDASDDFDPFLVPA
jgi:hypothetical protein